MRQGAAYGVKPLDSDKSIYNVMASDAISQGWQENGPWPERRMPASQRSVLTVTELLEGKSETFWTDASVE